jgi:gamma-glutamyltranspeptidase/glutathione hydrolase
MAPTIVLQDGRASMVVGSPGGSRIITIVLETILNVLDHGMTAQEAVDAPRVHHQWLPDTIYAEHRALSADTRAVLEEMGYTVTEQSNWGAAALIVVSPIGGANGAPGQIAPDAAASGGMMPGLLYGANDSRRTAGVAIGR